MSDHIPFLHNKNSIKLLRSYYADSKFTRFPIFRSDEFRDKLPKNIKAWVDPAIDGLHSFNSSSEGKWSDYIRSIPGYNKIADPNFQAKPDKKVVSEFVNFLLDRCLESDPAWISVPQLPQVSNSSRNKINRLLSKFSGDWLKFHAFSGKLILPVIFTHQDQLNGKTQRNPHIKSIGRCYKESCSSGYWVVDSTLSENGSKTLRNKRFPGIVSLHQELNEIISSRIRIAGPYWGMNILLWARGLVDFPAIGMGTGYQYFLPSGFFNRSADNLAIPCLRRRVSVSGLKNWLNIASKKIGSNHPAYPELKQMLKDFDLISLSEQAPKQIAQFYKKWFDHLISTPPAGRSMALFQDLSAAFALGRGLPNFPSSKTDKQPESIVEPLMLNCI